MSDKPPTPRSVVDFDKHRLSTYVWLRWSLVIVTGVFLLVLLLYRGTLWYLYGVNAENSISAYYYHANHDWPMRDLFVGALCAMGLMLVAYQGYRPAENYALNVSGLSLVLVAFVPMEHDPLKGVVPWVSLPKWHYAFAVVFFLGIIYVVWFRSYDTIEEITEERQKYYKGLYWFISVCMGLVVLLTVVFRTVDKNLDATFFPSYLLWAEFFGVSVFWLYWLVKSIELQNSKVDKKDQSELEPETKGSKAPSGK